MKISHKEGALLLTLLLSLAGCGGGNLKNNKGESSKPSPEVDMNMMMMEDDEEMVADLNSFFEGDEFVQDSEEMTAWLDASDEPFRPLYFDYDHQKPKTGQYDRLAFNVERAAEMISQAREEGVEAKLVVEGHSCSAGRASAAYKLALSEKRAKNVADALVNCGVDRGDIKVVGLGQEMPVVREGAPLLGSSEDQALNRRVEMHIVYS